MADDGGGHVCEPVAHARRGSRVGGSAVRAGALRAAVVSVAAVLALAGCTGTTSPAPSPPGTPGIVVPSGPTTTPSPRTAPIAPPEQPAAMDRHDADGAIAAATYFISLYPYVYATGDLAAWKAMSDPACGYCSGVSLAVESMHTTGSHIRGGEITVTATRSFPPNASTGVYPVDLELAEGPSIEVNAVGGELNEMAGGNTLAQLDVAWAATGWSIHAVKTTDEPGT